jgi:hypothetical protein
MTLVQDQAVDSWTSHESWFFQILGEDPLAIMLDWVPRSDQEASIEPTQVLVAIMRDCFDNTDYLGASSKNLASLKVFNLRKGTITHFDDTRARETRGTPAVVDSHAASRSKVHLLFSLCWLWRRHLIEDFISFIHERIE